ADGAAGLEALASGAIRSIGGLVDGIAASMRRLAGHLAAFDGVAGHLHARLHELIAPAIQDFPLLGGALEDIAAPLPAVRELDPALAADAEAFAAGAVARIRGICDVAAMQTAVDRLGRRERSVVDLHRVLAGTPPRAHWIVNL